MVQYQITEQNLKQKQQKAQELVRKKARTSAIAAIIPIPFLDAGTDMKLMKDIYGEIEEVFEVDHDDVSTTSDDIVTRAWVMATSIGSDLLRKNITPFIFRRFSRKQKFSRFGLVTIIGNVLGAAVSYYLMKKLGDDHIDHVMEHLKNQAA